MPNSILKTVAIATVILFVPTCFAESGTGEAPQWVLGAKTAYSDYYYDGNTKHISIVQLASIVHVRIKIVNKKYVSINRDGKTYVVKSATMDHYLNCYTGEYSAFNRVFQTTQGKLELGGTSQDIIALPGTGFFDLNQGLCNKYKKLFHR